MNKLLYVIKLAGALAFAPVDANAQTVTGENTATTKVTIVAGPDWGQKTEVVPVEPGAADQKPSGLLATTGDDASWATLAFAGVAAAGLMAWAIKKEEIGNGKEAANDGDA